MSSSNTSTAVVVVRRGARCDICQKSAHFRGMDGLRDCITCGVQVHDPCYGIPSKISKKNWECHACAAVGKTVLISHSSAKNKTTNTKTTTTTNTMMQQYRPQDCALCPIQTGLHAMHPLYDTSGPDGVQEVLVGHPARGLVKRLAWVHTACAVTISTSRKLGGCVYGCFEDGSYEDMAEEEEDTEAKVGKTKKKNKKNQEESDSESESEQEFEFGTGTTKPAATTTTTTNDSSQCNSCPPPPPLEEVPVPVPVGGVGVGGTTPTKKKISTSSSSSTPTKTKIVHPVEVGTKIARKFEDGIVYHGKIEQYDTKRKYYMIRYDDEDSEEIYCTQLHKYLTPAVVPAPVEAPVAVNDNGTAAAAADDDDDKTLAAAAADKAAAAAVAIPVLVPTAVKTEDIEKEVGTAAADAEALAILPVGTKVSKQFNDGIVYHGKVEAYDAIHHYYQVRYDDDDSEEIDDIEIQECIHGKIGGTQDEDEDASVLEEEMLHHYVIVGKEKRNSQSRGPMWTKQVKWIQELRATKCIYCGNASRLCPPTHLPMQCTAGEKGENVDLKQYHTAMEADSCGQSMHIGCALWDPKPFPSNRLYINPGFGNTEPSVELYCNLHAKQIKEGRISKKKHAKEQHLFPPEKSAGKRKQRHGSVVAARTTGDDWKPEYDNEDDDDDDDDLDFAYYDPAEVPLPPARRGSGGGGRGGAIASASNPMMMRAAPIVSKSLPRAAAAVRGGAKRKSSMTTTNKSNKAPSSSLLSALLSSEAGATDASAPTATTSLNRDSKKHFKVSRIEGKVYEKISSRNKRMRAALGNSDSRDRAIPIHDSDNDSDNDDKHAAASQRRSKILKQGLKSMKVSSKQQQQQQQQFSRSNSVTLLAEAGRKRKAAPPPVHGGDAYAIAPINNNNNSESSTRTTTNTATASSSVLPTTIRNEQQQQQHHEQQQQPPVLPLTVWSSMPEEQRHTLLTKIKNQFVHEVFRQFGNGHFNQSTKDAQKEYWKKRLVDSDFDNGNGTMKDNDEDESSTNNIRLSKDDFHVVWKEARKLLKKDDTFKTAVKGYNKGKAE